MTRALKIATRSEEADVAALPGLILTSADVQRGPRSRQIRSFRRRRCRNRILGRRPARCPCQFSRLRPLNGAWIFLAVRPGAMIISVPTGACCDTERDQTTAGHSREAPHHAPDDWVRRSRSPSSGQARVRPRRPKLSWTTHPTARRSSTEASFPSQIITVSAAGAGSLSVLFVAPHPPPAETGPPIIIQLYGEHPDSL